MISGGARLGHQNAAGYTASSSLIEALHILPASAHTDTLRLFPAHFFAAFIKSLSVYFHLNTISFPERTQDIKVTFLAGTIYKWPYLSISGKCLRC